MGDIQPQDLKPNSHTRVWWLCPDCGHEWQAAPGRPGCRPCGMKRSGNKHTKPAPGRSLLELYPIIAEQWDYDRNAPLTPADVAAGSNQHFWWVCEDCNHDWRACPSNRERCGKGARDASGGDREDGAQSSFWGSLVTCRYSIK
jgi:hypothetical protein